jgi:hypothetical protein
MKILKLKLGCPDLDKTIDYLIKNLQFDYENHSADMSVLASEEFYFRNGSTQLNMIIARLDKSDIYIDIMGGAGGSGLLNINWWSEKGYTNRVKKVLRKYAAEFNLLLEEIDTNGKKSTAQPSIPAR